MVSFHTGKNTLVRVSSPGIYPFRRYSKKGELICTLKPTHPRCIAPTPFKKLQFCPNLSLFPMCCSTLYMLGKYPLIKLLCFISLMFILKSCKVPLVNFLLIKCTVFCVGITCYFFSNMGSKVAWSCQCRGWNPRPSMMPCQSATAIRQEIF